MLQRFRKVVFKRWRLVILLLVSLSSFGISLIINPDLNRNDYSFDLGVIGNGDILFPHLEFFTDERTVIMKYRYTGNKTEVIGISMPPNFTLKEYKIAGDSGKNLTAGKDFELDFTSEKDKNQFGFASFKEPVGGSAEFIFEGVVIPNGLFYFEIHPMNPNIDQNRMREPVYAVSESVGKLQVAEGPEIMRFHLSKRVPPWNDYQLTNMWNIRNTKLTAFTQENETIIYVNYNLDHQPGQVLFVLNAFNRGRERLKDVFLWVSFTLIGYVIVVVLDELIGKKQE